MKKIILIGMGGLGKEIVGYISCLNEELDICGYYDDLKKDVGLKYFDTIKDLSFDSDCEYILSLSDPELKRNILMKANEKVMFASLNFGKSYSGIIIGNGSIVCPGAILTVDIKVGEHCLINLNATIGHDVEIGDFSSVMPGSNISGNVKIGKGVLIGTGAQILQGISIGDNSVVGAGAVVTKDVKAGTTVVGVPAREVKGSSRFKV